MTSLQGQLILDGGKLAGSPFHRAVVLVCVHDVQGAFGLVLNRQASQCLGEVAAEPVPSYLENELLFWGGPVQPGAFSCLVSDAAVDETDPGYVMPGLRLVHAPDEVPPPAGTDRDVKCFAGYAGWAAGQLDNEMEQDAWLTHPARTDQVFHDKPQQLWKMILASKGPRYRLLAETPDDVTRN